MNKNTIYNIDALQGLNNTPANSIDFILTDPPYGIADNNKRTKVGSKFVSTQEAWGNDFQDSWKDEKEYWAQFSTTCNSLPELLSKIDGSLKVKFRKSLSKYLQKMELTKKLEITPPGAEAPMRKIMKV